MIGTHMARVMYPARNSSQPTPEASVHDNPLGVAGHAPATHGKAAPVTALQAFRRSPCGSNGPGRLWAPPQDGTWMTGRVRTETQQAQQRQVAHCWAVARGGAARSGHQHDLCSLARALPHFRVPALPGLVENRHLRGGHHDRHELCAL